MPSYSEWLGRHLQNQQKFLDTRPHRTASQQTEVVKRDATIRVDRRPTGQKVVEASTQTDQVGGVAYNTGQGAQQKTPQLTITCASVAEPRLPEQKYNANVLKGLGRTRLANCCVTCGEPAQGAENCPCTRRNQMS